MQKAAVKAKYKATAFLAGIKKPEEISPNEKTVEWPDRETWKLEQASIVCFCDGNHRT